MNPGGVNIHDTELRRIVSGCEMDKWADWWHRWMVPDRASPQRVLRIAAVFARGVCFWAHRVGGMLLWCCTVVLAQWCWRPFRYRSAVACDFSLLLRIRANVAESAIETIVPLGCNGLGAPFSGVWMAPVRPSLAPSSQVWHRWRLAGPPLNGWHRCGWVAPYWMPLAVGWPQFGSPSFALSSHVWHRWALAGWVLDGCWMGSRVADVWHVSRCVAR